MKKKNPHSPDLARLVELREALAELHKTLIHAERFTYEKVFGTIPSSGKLLQLLTSDPWFAWMRPLSGLIAAIDEAMDAEEPISASEIAGFRKKAHTLLTPSEEGEGFGKHYFEALQREPDVILAHGKAAKLYR